MIDGALQGVRVVEWGNFISAPFCGKVLAELGADVIKVEAPISGDDSRRHGPCPGGVADQERSGLFLLANINKRGVSLDLGSQKGREVLNRLLEGADVFLLNQRPDVVQELALDYESLRPRFPQLIATAITPYGLTGPYKDYRGCDLTVNALGGLSFGTGYPHREPLTTPLYQASYLAGVGAAFATVTALIARDFSGQGQSVDVAEAQVVSALLTGYHLPTYTYRGIAGTRAGNRMRLGLFPNCVLPCKDGYVCIDAPQLEQYQRFLALMGDQTWTENPRYRNRRAMSDDYPEEAEALITPWFMEHTKEEILDLCLEHRVPCVPVLKFDEVLSDPQFNARDYFQELVHPRAGSLRYPGLPYRFFATQCRYVRPAPGLGQHNEEVFCGELGIETAEFQQMAALPLKNYRVMDLGTAWAGPMATQMLADMGDQVIKVESRERMDGLRLGRPIVGEDAAGGDRGLWPELQPVFHSLNRNKLGVTLNLKTVEGVSLAKELAASSDVVVDNYSPGVLQRLGLGYPALRQVRPDIICVSMPAMGDTGPLRDVLAYAPIIQALSGFMSRVGYQENELLVGEFQAPWSDAVSSIHASLALAAAIRHRNRTGEGQYIEVAQLEATASMLGEAVLDYQMTGRVAGPQGNADIEWAPHNNYPCAGEDKWVAIAAATEEEWQGFCRALGNPDWCSGPRFSGRTGRMAHRRELDEYVAAWTTVRSVDKVVGVLQANGVAAMGVMNIEDQFLDPHWRARRTYAEIEHPHVGAEWVYGVPWVLGDTPGEVHTPAPTLGQHNEFVFHQLLGVPIERLERLRSEKVIY